MNNVKISGRITKDPVTKVYDFGTVTNFSIAHNYTVKATGEKRTSFFDVVYFANASKSVAMDADLSSGIYVEITGYLRQDRWETSDGDKRARVVIVATDLNLPDNGSKKDQSPPYNKDPRKPRVNDDDDVPF